MCLFCPITTVQDCLCHPLPLFLCLSWALSRATRKAMPWGPLGHVVDCVGDLVQNLPLLS